MRLFKLGASWGGVHSLIAVNDPRKGRTSLDWLPSGPVWRLSIGLEALDDLIVDLEQAFASTSEIVAASQRLGRTAAE